MLGKTANGLFWMSRYLERAENTARLIETGQRIGLTRLDSQDDEWGSVLQTAGALEAFNAAHDTLTKDAAINWLLRDPANGSSIRACIDAARQNARLVRTAITPEMWEAINTGYMEVKTSLARKVPERDLTETLRGIRRNAALVRGSVQGTMMRNDIYNFTRMGTFLERADNTARILDVKYYVLLPSAHAVGSSIDNVQWESILRSLSARGGFRMEYSGDATPQDIVHFLILDRRMPRSLAFCMSALTEFLRIVDTSHPDAGAAFAMATALMAEELSLKVSEIFDEGLHEFLQTMQEKLAMLSQQVEQDFRFYA